MNIKIIISAIVIFIIGVAVGIFYQMQADSPTMKKVLWAEKAQGTFNLLSSELVPSVVAQGIVKDVNEKSIILTDGKNDFEVKINRDISILSLIEESEGKTQTLNDVKKGSLLNVNLKIASDGTLYSDLITIFPTPQQ